MKRVVDRLCKLKKTIATMESCTGGGVANEITNIPGASEVIRFSAVTYSNEYKIKMGVPASTIDQYSVYSMETAIDMSHAISKFADSDYGIGVTGKFCKKDPANPEGRDDLVYINIYDRKSQKDYGIEVHSEVTTRKKNKAKVIAAITSHLLEIVK